VISGGMIPKVEACLTGLKGTDRAHIIDGRVPHALLKELYTDQGVGTMIAHDVGDGYQISGEGARTRPTPSPVTRHPSPDAAAVADD